MRALARLILWLCLLAGPGLGETLSFTIPQARQLAREAYLAGDAPLAYSVAKGLLQRDPQDAAALLVVAATGPLLGFATEARLAGRQAFALVGSRPLRYEAARFTARAAFAERRFGLAQFWLRRAVEAAPSPQKRAATIRDFRDVRAQNPWQLGVDVALTPSGNLNDGSEGSALIIDGVPTVGTISGSGRALSGLRLSLGVEASYRLASNRKSETRAGLRLYGTLNRLSDAAKAQVMTPTGPALSGSDLNYGLAELTLTHRRALPFGLPLEVSATAGQSWYGGAAYATHLRLQAGQSFDLSRADRIGLQLSTERLAQIDGPASVARALGATLAHDTAAGNRLTAGLTLSQVESDSSNGDYRALSGQFGFALARPVGPVALSVHLTGSLRDYPAYRVGLITVPGGRQDDRLGLSLEAAIGALDVMGFSPVVRLEASRTLSNVSRYETSDLGISFSIRSSY